MYTWMKLPEGIDPWETSGVYGVDYDEDNSVWVWVDTGSYPYLPEVTPSGHGWILKAIHIFRSLMNGKNL